MTIAIAVGKIGVGLVLGMALIACQVFLVCMFMLVLREVRGKGNDAHGISLTVIDRPFAFLVLVAMAVSEWLWCMACYGLWMFLWG